nr:UDP-glucose iridoid glucosyltransferase-like [Ipomoea batatas]
MLRHRGIYDFDGTAKYKIDFSGKGRDIYPITAAGTVKMPSRWCIFNNDTSNMTKVDEQFQIACKYFDCTALYPDSSCSNLSHSSNVSYAFNMVYQAYSMLEEPLPDLHPLRYKDGPFHPTLDNDIPEPIRNFYRTTNDIRSAVACICNSTDYLEHSSLSKLQTHYKVPFFPIGPFHKLASSSSNSPTNLQEEDPTCLPWLDTQAPLSVLYVSFGSVAVVEKHAALETAWGLINSGRPGSVHGVRWTEFLPEGFEELVGRDRGRVVTWAPQQGVQHALLWGPS